MNDTNVVGVYKGLEYQHIHHNRAESYGLQEKKNQIVSQSKIILPRGIINFKKGAHSVSVERPQNKNIEQAHQRPYFNKEPRKTGHENPTPQFLKRAPDNDNTNIQVTFNEVEHALPNKANHEHIDSASLSSKSPKNGEFLTQKTFSQILEPRDESLMRKQKVIQILKTFQEQEEQSPKKKKQVGASNFGEEFDRLEREPSGDKNKGQQLIPQMLDNFKNDSQNHTYYTGKPIVIQNQNRVMKKKNLNMRRRDLPQESQKSAVVNPSSFMSDLNNFMLIEDLKINQQEEKFIQQTRLNKQKKELQQQVLSAINQGHHGEKPQPMGSFDQELSLAEQKRFEHDLGVQFDPNLEEPQSEGDDSDMLDLHENPDMAASHLGTHFNYEAQIKNIDSIFEPEPEIIQGDTPTEKPRV